MSEQDRNPTRRRVLTIVGGVTALTIALPSKWTKPIVESIVVPAHAQASGPTSTTGTGVTPTTTDSGVTTTTTLDPITTTTTTTPTTTPTTTAPG